jgi:hypothetical protein
VFVRDGREEIFNDKLYSNGKAIILKVETTIPRPENQYWLP